MLVIYLTQVDIITDTKYDSI